jgi:hypothetical protein
LAGGQGRFRLSGGLAGAGGRGAAGAGRATGAANRPPTKQPSRKEDEVKRNALLAVLAAFGVMLAAATGASAKPIERTCATTSKNVTTKNVQGFVYATNVDPSQASFAKCPTVKKVMNKMLSLRIEEPKVFEGFRCTPVVVQTEPDIVNYKCVFKGADTATFIKLIFTAKYDMD